MIKSPRVLGGPNSDRWGQPVRQIQDLNSWEPWQPLCCELSAGLCTRRSPTPAGHSSSGGCRVFGTPGARARGRLPRLLVCDLAAYHGEACMRPLRRQRRLPCRCGALSCGTTAGCAAASSSTWMWTAPTRGGKSSPKTRGDWGRNIERKPVVRYQAVTSRKGLQAVKSQMNQ